MIDMMNKGPIPNPRKNAAVNSIPHIKITITINGTFNFDKNVITLVWLDDNNSFLIRKD